MGYYVSYRYEGYIGALICDEDVINEYLKYGKHSDEETNEILEARFNKAFEAFKKTSDDYSSMRVFNDNDNKIKEDIKQMLDLWRIVKSVDHKGDTVYYLEPSDEEFYFKWHAEDGFMPYFLLYLVDPSKPTNFIMVFNGEDDTRWGWHIETGNGSARLSEITWAMRDILILEKRDEEIL